MDKDDLEAVSRIISACYDDPALFNDVVLGRPEYHAKQLEMTELALRYKTTCIVSGNSVGKSVWLAGMLLWYLFTRPDSVVIATSSTFNQLSNGLFRAVRDAFAGAALPLEALFGARITASPKQSPQRIDLDQNWFCIGLTSTQTDKVSGIRSKTGRTLIVADEASGVPEAIYEGLDSIGAEKMILIGNPLNRNNRFYELCRRGEAGSDDIGFLRVPSSDSPDWELEHSPRGLACQGWYRDILAKYGDGLYVKTHVHALWPEDDDRVLIPSAWLDASVDAVHQRGGPVWLAVDLAQGDKGDETVLLVRDSNGILEIQRSNRWEFPQVADLVVQLVAKYRIATHRVVYDRAGLGAGFRYFLEDRGLRGFRSYNGSTSGKTTARVANMRSGAAYMLRNRLDPSRLKGQPTFAIGPEHMRLMRESLAEARIDMNSKNQVVLESKEELKRRIGRSPDCMDALLISYSQPEL